MRVYLLNPPTESGIKIVREGRCMQRKGAWTTVWPPISLCYCASLLEKSRHEVRITDCSVEDSGTSDIKRNLSEFRPNLVVINTATVSIANDLNFAGIVKSLLPDATVAALGIHVTALPEESLTLQPDLDIVIRGEPELTTLELAAVLKEGRSLAEVAGISYQKEGKIIHNKDRLFIEDLDSLPYPAWHLIDVKKYKVPIKGRPFLLLMTGKGCPYSCTFCPAEPYYGKKIRLRNPKKIVDEIEWIKREFGVTDFLIWAELFTLKKDFVLKFCQEILDRKIKVDWICNSRVDTIDIEMLQKMRKAGCWMVGYGVESGSQEILDQTNKGITLPQIKKAVDYAKRVGMEVTAHVIFGLPGETHKTAEQTISLLKGLDLDYAQIYCAVPWPGTKLYEIAKNDKKLVTEDWSYFEQNQAVMRTKKLSAKEIEKYRRKALREFYVRPKLILKTIKKIRSLSEVKNFIFMIKDFVSWF